jgi:hypothetical protein
MEEDNWSLRSPEVQLTIELENGRRQLQSVKPEVQLQFELDSLTFLMDTSNGKEEPKMQEDVAGRKEVKE